MENTNEQREKDAHSVVEPALTELLLSRDGMVLSFGLIVALLLLSLQVVKSRDRTLTSFGFN